MDTTTAELSTTPRPPVRWRSILKWLLGSLGVLFVAICVWLYSTGVGAYLYAVYLEAKWSAADPETRIELEQHLSLYSIEDVEPSQSAWGRYHKMQRGERMVRYMILGSAPLDVVYDERDNITGIYTSYE